MSAPRGFSPDLIIDRAGLEEYLQDLAEMLPVVERSLARLKRTPTDRDVIADLFRALHNLKGDASICQVEIGVQITHPVETFIARLRSGDLVFSELLAEVVLLATDRLELAVEAMLHGRPLEHLRLGILIEGLDGLAPANESIFESRAIQLIEDVTGFRPTSANRNFKAAASLATRAPEQLAEDLQFFQQISVQLDARSPLYKGRSSRVLRLALDTNTIAGKPVDPLQLEAAVYMHDVGMMLLPESTWLKVGKLTVDDLERIHVHPEYGGGLLSRMAGWEEAAKIVLQHHEMPDGSGYPNQLKEAEICAGAKILAIVDAFEAIMLKHAHRGQGRSLLRAIAEINANDRQFSSTWIAHFNTVVRKRLEQ